MNKPKSLFKISRDKLFDKTYYCVDCSKMDQTVLQRNREMYHDEHENIVKLFVCKKCGYAVHSSAMIAHRMKYHQN